MQSDPDDQDYLEDWLGEPGSDDEYGEVDLVEYIEDEVGEQRR